MFIENIIDRETERDKSKDEILKSLYRLELSIAKTQEEKANSKTRFNCIPFSYLEFIRLMRGVVGKLKNIKFLDVGCGVGTKLSLMREFFKINHLSGIEINSLFAKVAENMFEFNEGKIFHGDARKFNKYGNYNLIYAYQPMKGDCWNKLEKEIKNQMKVGSIFVSVYCFGQPEIFEKT